MAAPKALFRSSICVFALNPDSAAAVTGLECDSSFWRLAKLKMAFYSRNSFDAACCFRTAVVLEVRSLVVVLAPPRAVPGISPARGFSVFPSDFLKLASACRPGPPAVVYVLSKLDLTLM